MEIDLSKCLNYRIKNKIFPKLKSIHCLCKFSNGLEMFRLRNFLGENDCKRHESFLSYLVLFLIDSKIIDDNAESESEDEEDENLPTSKSLLQNELEWVITSSLHGLQPHSNLQMSLLHTQKTLRLQHLFLKLISIHSHILFRAIPLKHMRYT